MDLSNENVIHIKKSDLQYLQFKELLKYDDIATHCFTLKSLEFGNNDTYKQKKELVIDNYKKICNCLNLNSNDVVRPYQTHSSNIKKAYKNGIFLDENREVDGLISTEPDKVLSLTYADCIPLYFLDPNRRIIANVHSGWQGTLKRIGEKAAKTLIEEYNCENLICAIGPCIRKCHFEVDTEVKEKFYKEFQDIRDIEEVITKEKQKYYIDTVEINRKMLIQAGLKEENIIDSKICTVCNSDLIYSYRGNNKTLCRNTSLICLR